LSYQAKKLTQYVDISDYFVHEDRSGDDLVAVGVQSGLSVYSDVSTYSEVSSPVKRLKEVVLSLDWEITDENVRRLGEEVERLAQTWREDKILLAFLRILRGLSNYLMAGKATVHPESVRLLYSVYNNLERIVLAEDMPLDKKTAIVLGELEHYNRLRNDIAGSTSAKSGGPVADELPAAADRAADDLLEPALTGLGESVAENERPPWLAGEESSDVAHRLDDFFGDNAAGKESMLTESAQEAVNGPALTPESEGAPELDAGRKAGESDEADDERVIFLDRARRRNEAGKEEKENDIPGIEPAGSPLDLCLIRSMVNRNALRTDHRFGEELRTAIATLIDAHTHEPLVVAYGHLLVLSGRCLEVRDERVRQAAAGILERITHHMEAAALRGRSPGHDALSTLAGTITEYADFLESSLLPMLTEARKESNGLCTCGYTSVKATIDQEEAKLPAAAEGARKPSDHSGPVTASPALAVIQPTARPGLWQRLRQLFKG